MWWIASVPFWVIGAAFFGAGIVWARDGIKGTVPSRTSVNSFMLAMFVSGTLFIVAAKIAS